MSILTRTLNALVEFSKITRDGMLMFGEAVGVVYTSPDKDECVQIDPATGYVGDTAYRIPGRGTDASNISGDMQRVMRDAGPRHKL